MAKPELKLNVELQCPTSPSHQHLRVYDYHGETCFCVCDDCGTTWSKTGERGADLPRYCLDLAVALKETKRVANPEGHHGEVILIDQHDANDIASTLIALARKLK